MDASRAIESGTPNELISRGGAGRRPVGTSRPAPRKPATMSPHPTPPTRSGRPQRTITAFGIVSLTNDLA